MERDLARNVTAGKRRVNETRVALESERRACRPLLVLRLIFIFALLLSQATKQGISGQVGG